MLTIISFLIVIFAVVIPHELGHLLFALRAGIRPLELGVGFGPKLFSFKKRRTVYSINAIPLGGFIRIAGLSTEEEEGFGPYPESESYIKKGPLSKGLTILGGPIMNFVFAFVLLSIVFAVFGSPAGISNELASIIKGSEAERAGLAPGDRIISMNGKLIKNMEETVELIHKSSGKKVSLVVLSGKSERTILVVPKYDPRLKAGLIGFSLKPSYQRVGLIEAIALGAKEVYSMTVLILVSIWMLISGQASLAGLAGPVGIAQFTGQAASSGLVSLLGFVAFLSVNLGVVNLLPLPVLDGGRVVFIVIEAIRRKPVPQQLENKIHYVGFAILLALAFMLTVNDIVRWVSMR